MCGFISGLSVVFHSSMCLFSCRYHTVLITTPLEYDLNSGSVLPPALIFFLRIALAISGHLWFHTSCEIFCSSFVKNVIGGLIRIALNV